MLITAVFTDPCKFISSPIEEAENLFFSQQIFDLFFRILQQQLLA